jgi:hypothetical protein
MPFLKKIAHSRLIILLVFCDVFFASAQTSTREYQVKAAFLFNFTQFVEWPAQCFSNPESKAIIGVLGKDPFGTYLEETIAGETINKHPLVIQRFNTVDEITNCHILFINISDKNKLKAILEKLKGKNILTVSDANGFAKLGGMVRLYTKDDKINIQVNLEAAKEENLIISSKLLKLAEIIITDKK